MLLCFSLFLTMMINRCIKASMFGYRMCCCGHWSKKVVLLPLSCHHSGRWGRVSRIDGWHPRVFGSDNEMVSDLSPSFLVN
jgi:hypothetical protein